MPSSAFQRPVSSVSTVDFLQALATNECTPTVNLTLPTRDPFWFIRAFTLIAKENLAYEIAVFSSADNLGGNVDDCNFIGSWQFSAMSATVPASPGYPMDPTDASPGDGLFKFYIDGNWIPYFDADQLDNANSASGGTYPANAKLHVRLVNRSAASKTANADGAVLLTVYCAAQGQQV